MFLVAITGGIATGKSTVTDVFRKKGIPIVDADKIAREIVEPGKPAWHDIKDAFGDEVFLPSRELNREALAKVIFNDKEKRGRLNEITHPRIHKTIILQVIKHLVSGAHYVVLDLPLLFETGILINYIHKIITVTCESDQQLRRLMDRNTYTEEDAKSRIASQMSLERKCEQSHFVIDNSGTIEQTQEEALKIFQLLNNSKHYIRIRLYIFLSFLVFVVFILWLNRQFHFLPFDL